MNVQSGVDQAGRLMEDVRSRTARQRNSKEKSRNNVGIVEFTTNSEMSYSRR